MQSQKAGESRKRRKSKIEESPSTISPRYFSCFLKYFFERKVPKAADSSPEALDHLSQSPEAETLT